MELIFVRHGQPEWTREGKAVVDPRLTDLGHVQAKRMAEALHDQHFDDLYVSPLQRARQTAAPLYATQGREEVIADWLRELGDPDWHGAPEKHVIDSFEEFDRRSPEERWEGLPTGEPVRDFAARIRSGALEFLAEKGMRRTDDELPVWHIDNPDQTMGFVAHAGTNTLSIGTLLGIPPTPWEWDRLTLGHASISRLVSKPASGGHIFRLIDLSNEEHLADDERTF